MSGLHYPVFVIASRDGVVAVKSEGLDCVMLFHDRATAEQQIRQIEVAQPQVGRLQALPIRDAESLKEGLESLPRDVPCVVWDLTGRPDRCDRMAVADLLRRASRC